MRGRSHMCSGLGLDLHPSGAQPISNHVSCQISVEYFVTVRAAIAGFVIHGGSPPDHTRWLLSRQRTTTVIVRSRIQPNSLSLGNPLCTLKVVIEFAANYTLPEIVVTGYNGIADINVREITKGIDSISYLGGGR